MVNVDLQQWNDRTMKNTTRDDQEFCKPAEKLEELLEQSSQEVLLALLIKYADEWKHFSNQIWSISSIFIPLSLSGIAFAFDKPFKTSVIAAFSIILIWIWYFLTDRAQMIIDNIWKIYAAIETKLLKLKEPLIKSGLTEVVPHRRRVSLRKIRLWIAATITGAWLFTAITSFFL
ncbi:MAG: hypothetical protein KME43_23085 [Myxacorys chilensis ATA2-1-KO14]|nr:hypothetical protein [Myxacorys chilensis ATA2-1-KO14]